MEHSNFKEIRKLKSRLPQQLVDKIHDHESEKKIKTTSVYKKNKVHIDSLSPSLKVNVKEELPSTAKNNTLRQTFLDSKTTKNENFVILKEEDKPVKKEEVITRPLKVTGENPAFLDYKSEVVKESFDDFYVGEKKTINWKFLYLFIFILITFLLFNFIFDLYKDKSNHSKLSHDGTDEIAISDFLGEDSDFINRDFNKEITDIVNVINTDNVPSDEVNALVDRILTDGDVYRFVTELDLNQTKAFLSILLNDILFDHTLVETKKIVIDENMVTLSAVDDDNDNLVLNPSILDLGIEDVKKSIHDLIINALVSDHLALEEPLFNLSAIVDYDNQLSSALEGLGGEDYYFRGGLKQLTDQYRENLKSRLSDSTEQGVHSMAIAIDKENREYTVYLEFFTNDIYAVVETDSSHDLELTYGSVEGNTSQLKLTLGFDEEINFIDHTGVELFPTIWFNKEVLSKPIYNHTLIVNELTSEALSYTLPNDFEGVAYDVCLSQSRKDICLENIVTGSEDFMFNGNTEINLVFDSEIMYKFYIDYYLEGQSLEGLLPSEYLDKSTLKITSEMISSMITESEKEEDTEHSK